MRSTTVEWHAAYNGHIRTTRWVRPALLDVAAPQALSCRLVSCMLPHGIATTCPVLGHLQAFGWRGVDLHPRSRRARAVVIRYWSAMT
jgi:hypothetical protein